MMLKEICEESVGWIIVLSHDPNHTFLSTFTFALSTFGMVLSIIALVMLLLTALLFIEWRKVYKNQVLIQFMVARFFYSSVRYFYDLTSLFQLRCSCFHPIYLDAIPLAYTEMVLVTWMCIFSKLMYESFVKIFPVGTPRLLRVSLAAWIVPGFVAAVLFIGYNLQDGRDVKFFVLYLFLLKWPVLCANGIFLILVLKNIISTNKSKTECNPRIVLVMSMLIFTFCFQQAIGDVYKLVYVTFKFKYTVPYTPLVFVFINIITVYHCAFSIIFWLLANKRTRVLWGFTKEKCVEKSYATNEVQLPK